MQNPYRKIVKLLVGKKVPYEIIKHKTVFTSEEAARVREYRKKHACPLAGFKMIFVVL